MPKGKLLVFKNIGAFIFGLVSRFWKIYPVLGRGTGFMVFPPSCAGTME